jgi:hypothetical protein
VHAERGVLEESAPLPSEAQMQRPGEQHHIGERYGLRERVEPVVEPIARGVAAPWQNAFVERFIGSAWRECCDHVIVFNEAGLHRLMTLYRSYYEQSRTHLALNKDTPIPREIAVPNVTAASWRSRRSAGCIIGTNGRRPDQPPNSVHQPESLLETDSTQTVKFGRRT